MKIAVIGCGPQCLFLVKSIAQRARELNIEKLVLMDEDRDLLSVYGTIASKLCRLLYPRLRFSETDNLVEALIGANYIIVLHTPGFDQTSVRSEQICDAHGLIAENGFGPAAYFSAVSAAPFLEKYCEYAKKYSKPDVRLLNFAPPCGLLTQLLREKGYDFVFGLGLSAAGYLREIASLLKTDVSRLDGSCYGISSLAVFDSVLLDGKPILDRLLESDALFSRTDASYFAPAFLQSRQLLPDRFFSLFLCGEQIQPKISDRYARDVNSRKELFAALKKTDPVNAFDDTLSVLNAWFEKQKISPLPQETDDVTVSSLNPFDRETTILAQETLRLIEALQTPNKQFIYLLVPNGDLYDFCASDEIVLAVCAVSSAGIERLNAHMKDDDFLEILRRVKRTESLLVRAVENEDAASALSGLALYPGIGSFTRAGSVLQSFSSKEAL